MIKRKERTGLLIPHLTRLGKGFPLLSRLSLVSLVSRLNRGREERNNARRSLCWLRSGNETASLSLFFEFEFHVLPRFSCTGMALDQSECSIDGYATSQFSIKSLNINTLFTTLLTSVFGNSIQTNQKRGKRRAFEFLVHLARRFRVLEMMRLGLLGENRGRRAKKEKERKRERGPATV